MSDALDAGPAPAAAPTTAGGLLRQARQAKGLHIAALAAAIKVSQRKLELLESDQFDQLPDAVFTRALAQTVCRTLKADAAPILALLPPPKGVRLDKVSAGLNTPFRERPGQLVPKEWASVATPALWLAALLVIAAAAVYVLPASWLAVPKAAVSLVTTADPAPVTEAPRLVSPGPPQASSPASPVASPSPEPGVAAAPSSEPPIVTEAEVVAAAAAAGVLQLRATTKSWVEVTDARGQSLISRVLEAGENVGLDGIMPLKVRIGNASGTQLVFRGQPMELASFTRDNVARLDLK